MNWPDTPERFAFLDHPHVTMDAARCLHAHDRYSDCALCVQLCPEKAIAPGKPPVLRVEACRSCLACLPACPAGAFEADDDVDSLLTFATFVKVKSFELLCDLHPHPGLGQDPGRIGVRIRGCLAGLGSGAYWMLATLGLEQVILRTDACGACEWGSLSLQIQDQAEQAAAFVTGREHSMGVECSGPIHDPVSRAVWEARNPPLSRRDFFRMLAGQGQAWIPPEMEADQAEKRRLLSRDRLRMFAAMEHTPGLRVPDDNDLGASGYALLSVSGACTACGACARVCPGGALTFKVNEEETSYSLVFNARYCNGCETCVHVCAPSSITVNHAPTFRQVYGVEVVVLQAGELVKCARCGARIANRSDHRLCLLCEQKRNNPFVSIRPPGLRPANLPLQEKNLAGKGHNR